MTKQKYLQEVYKNTMNLMKLTLPDRVKKIMHENCIVGTTYETIMENLGKDPELIDDYAQVAHHILEMADPDTERRLALKLIKLHGPKEALSMMTTKK